MNAREAGKQVRLFTSRPCPSPLVDTGTSTALSHCQVPEIDTRTQVFECSIMYSRITVLTLPKGLRLLTPDSLRGWPATSKQTEYAQVLGYNNNPADDQSINRIVDFKQGQQMRTA